MLVAEIVRLAAIEVLCPTASINSNSDFPTLAGKNVLDSRELDISELDNEEPFTPVLALYTGNVDSENRSGDAGGDDFDNTCILEVVGELVVIQRDEEADENFVDAMAGSDPAAKMTLAAMMTQVRHLLETSPSGQIFRQFVRSVNKYEAEPFAVPNLGLRWQRITGRFTVSIGSDCLDAATGQPDVLRDLVTLLPAGSYALSQASKLLDQFNAPVNTPLETPDVMQGETPDTIVDRKDPTL